MALTSARKSSCRLLLPGKYLRGANACLNRWLAMSFGECLKLYPDAAFPLAINKFQHGKGDALRVVALMSDFPASACGLPPCFTLENGGKFFDQFDGIMIVKHGVCTIKFSQIIVDPGAGKQPIAKEVSNAI